MELKSYDTTEFADIPNDWTVRRLQDLTTQIIDGSHFTPTYTADGVPFLRVTDVQTDAIDFSAIKFISKKEHEVFKKRCHPKKGDILLSKNGTIGIPKRVTWDWEFSIFVSLALIKVKKSKIDGEFLEQFFKSNFVKNQISQRSKQGTVTNLHLEEIREFLIPIPPTINEQTAIATALSDADALIASLEKLIAKKRLIKQGVMQKLLEPKEGWAEKSFGEIFHFLPTSNYSRAQLSQSGDIGYIHYGDIHTKWNGVMDVSKNHLPKVTRQQAEGYAFVQHGDLIVVDASEDYSGVSKSIEVINPNNEKVISGLHTFLLRDKEPSFVDGFRGYIQYSQIVKEQLDRLATGMKVFGVSKGNLKTVMIPIPPKSEQKVIVSILRDIDKEVDTLECKLAKMRILKQGMMQTLLTGKIRLI